MVFQAFKSAVPQPVLQQPASERYVRGTLIHETRWTQTYRVAGDPGLMLKCARADLDSERERDFAHGLIRREALVSAEVQQRGLMATISAQWLDQVPCLVQPTCSDAADLVGAWHVQHLWTIRQIAEALNALHAAGWLHGNVSPEAIRVTAQGHATLTDLGWCRELDSDECNLQETPFAGSVRYCAPEFFDDRGSAATSADVYSLGAVLYELVAGETFLAQYDVAELVAAKRLLTSRELASPAHVSFRISAMLKQMLARDPLRRPTIRQVIESLVAAEVESFGRWTAAA